MFEAAISIFLFFGTESDLDLDLDYERSSFPFLRPTSQRDVTSRKRAGPRLRAKSRPASRVPESGAGVMHRKSGERENKIYGSIAVTSLSPFVAGRSPRRFANRMIAAKLTSSRCVLS